MIEIDETIQKLSSWRGRTALAAMSGGVDSSLAAALLSMAGARVIGVQMRVWHDEDCRPGDGQATCCSPEDARDARRVADRFGFPFYVLDFQEGFRRAVIEPFTRDYLAGRTPNPCVLCNNRLKLGSLLEKAMAYGAEAVATGHYGRLADDPATGRRALRVAADRAKDQSYYLFGLTQDQLRRFMMPLGELTKTQARRMARELGLAVADKPDSQEICFVTDNDYRRFLREDAGVDEAALAGEIVDMEGRVLGRHAGIHNYTIGQRHGLGIAAARPFYVVALEAKARRVVVGHEEAVASPELTMDGINWVGRAPAMEPFRAIVKIRYRSPGQAAWIYPEAPGGAANEEPAVARVVFDAPARAAAPGQAAVAYDEPTGESVLMGGWIRQGR
jgi:tRNA-specific 2-thiouridylase